MDDLLTTTQMFAALGKHYGHLTEAYDRKRHERRATDRVKQGLLPRICAACGVADNEVYRLEAAHIAPLSECETTSLENLFWLCRGRKERQGAADAGCHTLFDDGCCSIADMRECRRQWVIGSPANYRDRMIAMRARFGAMQLQQGNLKKELDRRIAHRDSASGDHDWHERQIDVVEGYRRLARKGALDQAVIEISRVDYERLSRRYKSRYHYERGYIALLRGELANALTEFEVGRKPLIEDAAGDGWRWASHSALCAQLSCVMRSAPGLKGWSWQQTRKELSQALSRAKKDVIALTPSGNQTELRHAQRWVQNCLIHLIKPEIAESNLETAKRRWDKAYDNWQAMDIASGWDRGFRATFLSLYGRVQLAAAEDDRSIDAALAYLVRALVLFRMRRHQPEGMRDLLFSISDALQRKGDSIHGEIRAVASRCADASSWFNPHIPARTV